MSLPLIHLKWVLKRKMVLFSIVIVSWSLLSCHAQSVVQQFVDSSTNARVCAKIFVEPDDYWVQNSHLVKFVAKDGRELAIFHVIDSSLVDSSLTKLIRENYIKQSCSSGDVNGNSLFNFYYKGSLFLIKACKECDSKLEINDCSRFKKKLTDLLRRLKVKNSY